MTAGAGTQSLPGFGVSPMRVVSRELLVVSPTVPPAGAGTQSLPGFGVSPNIHFHGGGVGVTKWP
jgi:hypothetical protein